MDAPLVSVICLCYNHEKYVEEAIDSVLRQTYSNLEIIVVDDHSTDASPLTIGRIVASNPRVRYLPLPQNIGNCAAFNRGLAVSKGSYIVDFSTDDVMEAERIEKQIAHFKSLDPSYGVVFTDVLYIDQESRPLYSHFDYLVKRNLIREIPQGDIYQHLLQTYFVSSPSMLVRREVLDQLKGYDEELAYEDFDFWIRSSRNFKYAYLNEILTKVRKTSHSLSRQAYAAGSRQLYSTYLVCRKAINLNRNAKENAALITRLRYEFRHAVLSQNFKEGKLFHDFLREISLLNNRDRLVFYIMKARLPLAWIRRLYHRLWFR